ncbi:hypothetical protein BH24DEI1_BH24DEI1_09000 [soil metagenome]|nr:DUF3248 domain-containing protein [Deinococcota bacterium]
MSDDLLDFDLGQLVESVVSARSLDPKQAEGLASQLVWRLGRLADDTPVTVRVGFATSARLFADLPKLKNASDHEVEAAIKGGDLRVEWVGPL